ncbi:MAG: class I SAM-dependent methyltransferase family protein [Thermoplasmata archaeon]
MPLDSVGDFQVLRQRGGRETPYDAVRAVAKLPEALKDLLPRRWERIGEVLILRLPPPLEARGEQVGEAYGHALGVKAVIQETNGIQGSFRSPQTSLLWGEETETVHTENGIRYRLDPTKVMFSAGNMNERGRMGRLVEPWEEVVDLFAGIGYFALPMALHGGARRVVACEINPMAFGYLRENVQLNKASGVEPRLGDCREVAPDDAGDRVVLGYLRDTHRFLAKALRVLRSPGWLHYHEACPDRAAERLEAHLREATRDANRDVLILQQHRVKAYAPGVSHWVLDARIS